MEAEFIKSAAKPDHFPPPSHPEIAFLGRSNAGKSTLLNAIAKQKGLARAGATPGVTQLVNFFEVKTPKPFMLVDLPGFGFRKAPKDVSANWEITINAYLRRPNIAHFVFLTDARRELEEDDLYVLSMISKQKAPVILMTKVDKLNQAERHACSTRMNEQLSSLNITPAYLNMISSLKGNGVKEVSRYLFSSQS